MSTPVMCFDSVSRICECNSAPPEFHEFNVSLPLPTKPTAMTYTSKDNRSLIYGLVFGFLSILFILFVVIALYKRFRSKNNKYDLRKSSISFNTGQGEKAAVAI